MTLETIPQTSPMNAYHDRLDAEGRHPALAAEAAIRRAIAAANAGDGQTVHHEVEYAKYAIISRRCGMETTGCDLMAVIRSPGLALCSGLSNVSEMAQQGRLDGTVRMLAEAAMRAHALAG